MMRHTEVFEMGSDLAVRLVAEHAQLNGRSPAVLNGLASSEPFVQEMCCDSVPHVQSR